ncbi:MAG: glycosyltransferase family 4 protein [Acidobacteria bacterium]|nr:glycosyltransferase family 4 protein [Acidobacteriota bacterium]
MAPVVLVVPGRIEARTGGTIYDRRIVHGLRDRGWHVDVLELDASFPYPTPVARAHADEALAGIAPGTIVIVDSLALGALPDLITREAGRVRIVALVHQPLAAATGLDADVAARFAQAERQALAVATLVVITGHAARALLAPYAVPPERIVVVEPGTDTPPDAIGSRGDRRADTAGRGSARGLGAVALLSVGTVHPGKGHDLLLDALAAVESRSWHLTCAGSLTRDPSTTSRLRELARRLGLADHVSFVGDLDRPELAARYDAADVFVLATRQETYGMAVAEALAHGLPVVATMTGAIPKLVGDEAGILVPVDDKAALVAALARVLDDASLRARLGDGARRARQRLPTWAAAAERMSGALSALTVHG